MDSTHSGLALGYGPHEQEAWKTFRASYSPIDYALPILNTLVPQTEQVPWVAGLPFLSVTAVGLRTSRFVLHFMQYASIETSTGIGYT